jgi:hypothetical protein
MLSEDLLCLELLIQSLRHFDWLISGSEFRHYGMPLVGHAAAPPRHLLLFSLTLSHSHTFCSRLTWQIMDVHLPSTLFDMVQVA